MLVVGSGQSGTQIADELAIAGREVLLATSRVPRVPRRYRGRDVHEWAVELGVYDQPTEAVTDPAEFTEPHPMLSGAHGGHTVAYQQLARDGVRLLGRLTGAEGDRLRFGPDLPGNMQYADAGAARFRRMVDEYVTRAGIVAPDPDTDPAERPEPRLERSPESLDIRAERIAAVIWCTGFGPDTGWLHVPVLQAGRHPGAHPRRHRVPRPVRGWLPVAVEPRIWPVVRRRRRRRRGSRSTSRPPRRSRVATATRSGVRGEREPRWKAASR